MDPVSVGLLAALAGGAGGEIGRQAWAALTALVRRPFRSAAAPAAEVSTGEPELAALHRAPDDPSRAHALSTALAVRAALDADFGAGLREWQEQAARVRLDQGSVSNTISGGTQYGTVIQGRDFSGLTFTTQPPQSSQPLQPPPVPPAPRQTPPDGPDGGDGRDTPDTHSGGAAPAGS
jgi:hypothetical protein